MEDLLEGPDGTFRTAEGTHQHMQENPTEYLPKVEYAPYTLAEPFSVIINYGLKYKVRTTLNSILLPF